VEEVVAPLSIHSELDPIALSKSLLQVAYVLGAAGWPGYKTERDRDKSIFAWRNYDRWIVKQLGRAAGRRQLYRARDTTLQLHPDRIVARPRRQHERRAFYAGQNHTSLRRICKLHDCRKYDKAVLLSRERDVVSDLAYCYALEREPCD